MATHSQIVNTMSSVSLPLKWPSPWRIKESITWFADFHLFEGWTKWLDDSIVKSRDYWLCGNICICYFSWNSYAEDTKIMSVVASSERMEDTVTPGKKVKATVHAATNTWLRCLFRKEEQYENSTEIMGDNQHLKEIIPHDAYIVEAKSPNDVKKLC